MWSDALAVPMQVRGFISIFLGSIDKYLNFNDSDENSFIRWLIM